MGFDHLDWFYFVVWSPAKDQGHLRSERLLELEMLYQDSKEPLAILVVP
jgi:hypothetical protein